MKIRLILVLLVPTLASSLRGYHRVEETHDTAGPRVLLVGGMTFANGGMGGGGGIDRVGGNTKQQIIQSIVPSRPIAQPDVSPVFPGPTTINHNETVPTIPPTDINPASLAVIAPAVSPYTCRSPVSTAYQRSSQPPVDTIPGVHACSGDRDCIGFVSKDSPSGSTCCVHTFCICGVMILAEDGSSTRCVGTATAPPAVTTTPGVATQSPISKGVDGSVIMPPTDPDQADVVDGRNSKQLGWQIFAVVVYLVLAFGTCSIIFLTLDKFGMLHVSPGVDLADMDSHHHGGHAYLVRDDVAIVKKANAIESPSEGPAEDGVPQ